MLYHRQIKWYKGFDEGSNKIIDSNLCISDHLYNHIENGTDQKHNINIDKLFDILEDIKANKPKPFEVEISNGKVSKTVIRCSYDDINDIVITLRINKVITAWLNKKNDNHNTLDYNKYMH